MFGEYHIAQMQHSGLTRLPSAGGLRMRCMRGLFFFYLVSFDGVGTEQSRLGKSRDISCNAMHFTGAAKRQNNTNLVTSKNT